MIDRAGVLVVVDFGVVPLALYRERAQVMFVVRIVVLRELIEGSDALKHAGFEVFGQSVNASRCNNQATDESHAELVIKFAARGSATEWRLTLRGYDHTPFMRSRPGMPCDAMWTNLEESGT